MQLSHGPPLNTSLRHHVNRASGARVALTVDHEAVFRARLEGEDLHGRRIVVSNLDGAMLIASIESPRKAAGGDALALGQNFT